MKIGLFCGGSSLERGISLNSARSVMDHLQGGGVEICPFYVDRFLNFYQISPSQLYSNTPSDFDFKLKHLARRLTREELFTELKKMDIVFPAIHGAFGEDGQLQAMLEEQNIPYVGCDSKACQSMFFKNRMAGILRENGFDTIDSLLLEMGDSKNFEKIKEFFDTRNLRRVVVKPVAGGSSIGVSSAATPQEAFDNLNHLFARGIESKAIVEPFCEGREFTVIVMENPAAEPVALVPTEIVISYENGQLFDYRRKYLPTTNTKWLSPPSFDDGIVEKIRSDAKRIFRIFGMRDFARLDGWLLNDGRVIFSDLNPISGMEQNSFIFQQSTRVGFTHKDVLKYVSSHALSRLGLTYPAAETAKNVSNKEPVYVLFGGATAERHVSVMSGTNVWLKLRQSEKFDPIPCFLDENEQVWRLPYPYALSHTAEEIFENCEAAAAGAPRLSRYVDEIRACLGLDPKSYRVADNLPTHQSFDDFVKTARDNGAFVFLALHGGSGEDGTYQGKLQEAGIFYNGSGQAASQICMDKNRTGEVITAMNDPLIITAPKKKITADTLKNFSQKELELYWRGLVNDLATSSVIIKPANDGCSAGIVHLYDAQDLGKYGALLRDRAQWIPPDTFKGQKDIVEMSLDSKGTYLIEAFIRTDKIVMKGNELSVIPEQGWIECTVGVLESGGVYHALSPSMTIAEGEVLSLEEKFQGGTGVNITPPPSEIVPASMLPVIAAAVEKSAKALGIENYARIDIFFNVKSGQIILIEANTLPGLTPSTVIYHQGLAEIPSLTPTAFLEKIIDLKTGKTCQAKVQDVQPSSSGAPLVQNG